MNGGVGKRLAAGFPKQFIRLNGIPILAYTLATLNAISEVTEIVINYPEGEEATVKKIVADYGVSKPVKYVSPGVTRHQSVQKLIDAASNENILLHEAARPFASKEEFRALINNPAANVTLVSEIPFTVAPIDIEKNTVTGYLDRAKLRNVQLPQKFALADLKRAHEFSKGQNIETTEDATLCALAGIEVKLQPGSDKNFKITTPVDLELANTFVRQERGLDV